jgi:hypothetical protein
VNVALLVDFFDTLNPMTVAILGATAFPLNGIAKEQIPKRVAGVGLARRIRGKTFQPTNDSVSEGD